ncbi:hypothetical protein Aduo_000703 [Ancylostoma duodenale]
MQGKLHNQVKTNLLRTKGARQLTTRSKKICSSVEALTNGVAVRSSPPTGGFSSASYRAPPTAKKPL